LPVVADWLFLLLADRLLLLWIDALLVVVWLTWTFECGPVVSTLTELAAAAPTPKAAVAIAIEA
ncbi:MAG TPA: hypothetical protein VLF67_04780, partial [Candidatus Saccharimonas sp.]|nr:hypothetical protein [Candidatus Saccharimonas sp.]